MWWKTNHYIGPVHVVLAMAMVAVHNHQTSCFSWVDADGVIPSCQVWQFWVDSITRRWSSWLKFWEQFCENRKKGFFQSICYIVAVRKLNLGQTLGFTRVNEAFVSLPCKVITNGTHAQAKTRGTKIGWVKSIPYTNLTAAKCDENFFLCV